MWSFLNIFSLQSDYHLWFVSKFLRKWHFTLHVLFAERLIVIESMWYGKPIWPHPGLPLPDHGTKASYIYIQVWQLTLLTKTGTKKRILTWEAIHPAYVGWYYRLMLILTLPPHPALIHTNLLQMISTNPYTHFSFLHQRSPWGWLSVYWSIIIYIFLCPI